MNKQLIKVTNVSKKIKNHQILDNVSFNILENSIVGFIGDNGAGKTTTIKAILNLLHLDSGEIYYRNEKIASNNLRSLKYISYFPDLNNIPLSMTVWNYCIFIGLNLGMNYKEIRGIINELARRINVVDILHKKFKHLSSGLKKKGLLLSVLIGEPELIILDEPTANLDVGTRSELIDMLIILNRLGKTIFITSHIIDELEKIINQVVIIKDGKIVYDDLYDNGNSNLKELYEKYAKKSKNKYLVDYANSTLSLKSTNN